MPSRARRSCGKPACPQLQPCPEHARRRELDRHRGSARARGYDRRWEKARVAWLAQHPLCAACARAQLTAAAALVDHVVPHRGDRLLFWDPDNWQSLCSRCHAAKSARESGIAPCAHASAAMIVRGTAACVECGGAIVVPAPGGGARSLEASALGPREVPSFPDYENTNG